MSRHRELPVFVAVPKDAASQTCGHQHSYEPQAVNCAKNILRRRRFLGAVDVIKCGWRGKSDLLTQETMLTVTRKDLDEPAAA